MGPTNVALCVEDMLCECDGGTYSLTVWRFASCLSVSDKVPELLQNGHGVGCGRMRANGLKGLMSRPVFKVGGPLVVYSSVLAAGADERS